MLGFTFFVALFPVPITNIFRLVLTGILDQIAAIDELGILPHDYSSLIKFQLGNILWTLVYFLIGLLQFYHINRKHKVINADTFLICDIPSVFRYINDCFYLNIVKILFAKTKLLNGKLASIFNDDLKINQKGKLLFVKEYQKPNDSQLDKLETLMNMYQKLIRIQMNINKTFSVQIFVTIANLFFNVLFLGFNCYYEFKIQQRFISSMNWLGCLLIVSSEIIWIVTLCHRTTKQLQHTGTIIHKILDTKEVVSDLWKKLMIFSQQVQISNSKFVAMGVIELNAALIFKFVSGTSTYQLLMIQYEEGIQNQCLNSTIV